MAARSFTSEPYQQSLGRVFTTPGLQGFLKLHDVADALLSEVWDAPVGLQRYKATLF